MLKAMLVDGWELMSSHAAASVQQGMYCHFTYLTCGRTSNLTVYLLRVFPT